MKVLQYADLSKMGKTEVYSLEFPNFFNSMVKQDYSLDNILSRVTYEAHELLGEMYPMAVATKEEWLEYMKMEQVENIEDATKTLKALNKLENKI
jgi:hypothetical protein